MCLFHSEITIFPKSQFSNRKKTRFRVAIMSLTADDTPNASATSTLTTTSSITIKDYAPRSMISIVSDVSSQDAWESNNFDIESTRKVLLLLSALEEFLFTEVGKTCPVMVKTECLEWSGVFPHFRFGVL
jgi:hypothetical protein